jgi:ribosomal protein S12 methylthiotransferase accessory factor YcaO
MCKHLQNLLSKGLHALEGRFVIHEVSDQEQPVFLTAAFPLREGLTGRKPRLASGRGLSLVQAQISAVGETVEMLASLATPQLRSSSRIILKDANDAVLASDMLNHEAVEVPACDVFLDYAALFEQPGAGPADTNGCAAGTSVDDACERALLECIERDALAIWWYGRQPRNQFDLGALDAAAPRVSWWLANRPRRTMLIDITSDIGVPVVAAVSAESDGTQIAIGSAASRKLSIAAVSAITEMVQTETTMRMARHSGNEELDQWLANATVGTLPQCAGRQIEVSLMAGACGNILQLVSQAGFRPLSIDLSDEQYPLSVARVIVPGLCAMQRRFDPDRILKHAHFAEAGAQAIAQYESLEPF